MKIPIKIDDDETRAIWDAAERTAKEVAHWPKWKRAVAEEISVFRSTDDNDIEMPSDIKESINNLLWSVLPGSTSLARADSIAGEIYGIIVDEWRRNGSEAK